MKKMLNEGNQIHNFISSSRSGTVINCGFGSNFLTSYGSDSVPVPLVKKLRFLQSRFRLRLWFHNAAVKTEFSTQNRFIENQTPKKDNIMRFRPLLPHSLSNFTEDVYVINDHLHTVDKNARSPQ
jgi:hypothetical protein